MTAATSVPQSSNPPLREGIGGLPSLASAKGIHLRRTRARVSRTRPHGRSLWKPLEPLGPGLGIFPGTLSGPRPSLSPAECPRRPLTPAGHLHPAISGPLPPWGPDTRGRGASNWPTWRQSRRPLRPVPPTAKIPLFFHPERGPPFRMEEQGGGPQEMALFRAAAGWFRARTWGRACAGQVPPAQASLGATHPTHEISGQVPRVPGLVSGDLEALPATHGTARFPLHPTSQPFSLPPGAEYPWKTWGHGANTRAPPRFQERWSGPGLARCPPLDGFSPGVSGLCPAWADRIPSLAQTAPPCPEAENSTQRLQLPKVWAKLREKGL